MSSLRRLLLVVGGSGGFTDMGYSMTAPEVAYWADMAALLDPEAYEYVDTNSITRTVPSDEHWYLLNGWYMDATGAGTSWFHRPIHYEQAMILSADTVIETGTAPAGEAFMYLCKPSLVTGTDDRYTLDPRALFFERLARLGELEQFQIGAVNTGSGVVDVDFPGGFTNGLGLHTSSHDVAWLILRNVDGDSGINTLNELSDGSNQIRFAEMTIFPFKTTTFPNIEIQGSSKSEGRATFTYVKLPMDW